MPESRLAGIGLLAALLFAEAACVPDLGSVACVLDADCPAPQMCQNSSCVSAADGGVALDAAATDAVDRDACTPTPERWDLRDNDCDGSVDEEGLQRWDRYVRVWSDVDWEHRFATFAPADYQRDGGWLLLYPTNVCSDPTLSPLDDCVRNPGNGGPGTSISLSEGSLLALAECRGMLGEHHVSLYLLEVGGEYLDYATDGPLDCARIGYVYEEPSHMRVPSAKLFYRHMSGFGFGGLGDNMWSTQQDEGNSQSYGLHREAWWAPGGR